MVNNSSAQLEPKILFTLSVIWPTNHQNNLGNPYRHHSQAQIFPHGFQSLS